MSVSDWFTIKAYQNPFCGFNYKEELKTQLIVRPVNLVITDSENGETRVRLTFPVV